MIWKRVILWWMTLLTLVFASAGASARSDVSPKPHVGGIDLAATICIEASRLASAEERRGNWDAATTDTSDVPHAARAGGETVSLFRAVGDAELKVIQASGRVPASLSGLEVKYFSATAEGASSYARQAVRGFGDAPYTLIETQVSRSSLPASVLQQVDRNVPAVILPNSQLPSLGPAQVWTHMPVP